MKQGRDGAAVVRAISAELGARDDTWTQVIAYAKQIHDDAIFDTIAYVREHHLGNGAFKKQS